MTWPQKERPVAPPGGSRSRNEVLQRGTGEASEASLVETTLGLSQKGASFLRLNHMTSTIDNARSCAGIGALRQIARFRHLPFWGI